MKPLPQAVTNCLKNARENICYANIAMGKALDDLQQAEPSLYAELRALLIQGGQLRDKLEAIRVKVEASRARCAIPLRGALALDSIEQLMLEGGIHDLSEFRFVPPQAVARRRGVGKLALKTFTEGLASMGITLGGEWPEGEDWRRWREVLAERGGRP